MPQPIDPRSLAALNDAELLEFVQRQTFRFFWEGAHPVSGLAPDRRSRLAGPVDDLVATGGTGYGVLALLVAAERGWQTRDEVVARLTTILDLLTRATRHHGAFPHFMHGSNGATIPFMPRDDGGDLVETALLFMALLCAREYFDRGDRSEADVRAAITALWLDIEWNWYTRGGRDVLFWHWSPNHGWAMNQEIRGWNECLIAYVLAAAHPLHGIDAEAYHRGFASGPTFRNGSRYYGISLPLGPPYGGPLYFSHYSFCTLDPRGLRDRYADYWQQCSAHVGINRAYCLHNPGEHAGYGAACWGLTSSEGPHGYRGHEPAADDGTIAPTAALASLPYAPLESLQAIRHFLTVHGEGIWDRYGFVDAFNLDQGWYADAYLAIDQGPILAMIENHRTGLLWRLFMSVPDVRAGLHKLGFTSPWLVAAPKR